MLGTFRIRRLTCHTLLNFLSLTDRYTAARSLSKALSVYGLFSYYLDCSLQREPLVSDGAHHCHDHGTDGLDLISIKLVRLRREERDECRLPRHGDAKALRVGHNDCGWRYSEDFGEPHDGRRLRERLHGVISDGAEVLSTDSHGICQGGVGRSYAGVDCPLHKLRDRRHSPIVRGALTLANHVAPRTVYHQ